MKYSVSIERMESVIAPGVWADIKNAVVSFFNGFFDGLNNGYLF